MFKFCLIGLLGFCVATHAQVCRISATIDGWDIYGRGVYHSPKNRSKNNKDVVWTFKLNPPHGHVFRSVRYSQDVLPNLYYRITQRIGHSSDESFVSSKVWPKPVKDFMDIYLMKYVWYRSTDFFVEGVRETFKHPKRQRVDYPTNTERTVEMKKISKLIPMLILKSNQVQPSIFDVELSMYFKAGNYQTAFAGTTYEF